MFSTKQLLKVLPSLMAFGLIDQARAIGLMQYVTIAKSFNPAEIIMNGTSTLTITIEAPLFGGDLTDIATADLFPAGILVAASPNFATTCVAGTQVQGAVAGSTGLAGITVPSLTGGASCTLSVNVTGTMPGVIFNETAIITANQAIVGAVSGPSALATLTVVAPPKLTKVFGVGNIQVGGATTLTFTLTNPDNNPTDFTNLAFSDTLPAGVLISNPSGLNGSCAGGAMSAPDGTNLIALSGAALVAGTNCTFSLNVVAIALGAQTNITSGITDNEGFVGAPATATLNVVNPPVIGKAFADSTIELMSIGSTLAFTLANPNVTPMTDIAFFDNLPEGIVLASPDSGLNPGTCAGASMSAPAGGSTITLGGLTLTPNNVCSFSVQVLAAALGTWTNITSPVTAFGGTVVGNRASATISVQDHFFLSFFGDSSGGGKQ